MYIEFIENPNNYLPMLAVIHSDGECFDRTIDGIAAVANEFPDFVGFINDGAPVFVGNSAAFYEFRVLIDGYQYTFAMADDDVCRLNVDGKCTLYAASFNELGE